MEFVKIAEICQISNGYAFKSGKYVDNNGARIIRITNVQKGEIVDNDPKFYPFNLLDSLDNYKILEGDILMSLTGNVGRVGKFPKELLPAYINQRICRVMPKDNSLDVNYLFHYLNSNIFEKEAIRNSAGAAQLNLSTKWLENHLIPLPPLEEQKAIAARLDKADQIRQLNQQIINHYDELIQALFIDMFGDPVKNEKGWEKKKLKDILYYIDSGWSPVCENIPRNNINEWAVLKLGSISNGKYNFKENKLFKSEIDESKLKNEVKNGDLLFVRKNTLHLVGRTVYVNKTEPKLIIPDTIFNLKYNNSLINPMFLNLHINSYKFLKIIQSNASGTAGSMPNISKSKLLDIKINYPPLDLQNQFAERVQKIEAQKQLAQESLEQSQNLFNSLLQQSFAS